MWLDNLKELKEKTGKTAKQIAEETKLPERTVTRIFSGDTDHPYVDTIHRIVTALGGTLDSIFVDTKVVVGDSNLIEVQTEAEKLTAELGLANAEIAMLKDKVCSLTSENDMLRLKLEHKEEIIALHNYYMKFRSSD